MINSQVKEYTGVFDMLSELKNRGIKLGIVSSKYKRYVLQELENTNLLSFFDVIVGLDDCTNRKPHPEPLLKAINTLNEKAENCIYIGDQPTDIVGPVIPIPVVPISPVGPVEPVAPVAPVAPVGVRGFLEVLLLRLRQFLWLPLDLSYQ